MKISSIFSAILMSMNYTYSSGARWLCGPVGGLGVRNLPPPFCVLEQDTKQKYSPKVLVIPRNPKMTEKLLTWTLSLNTYKYMFINGIVRFRP